MMSYRLRFAAALTAAFLLASLTTAATAQTTTPPAGLRVFSAGHSFHYFMPPILSDIAKKADIKDHKQVGLSSIGGSRVIQHWNVAEDKNKAKEVLKAGKVDVFTMS